MAWSMKAEGESLNDGGRKLKVGTYVYKIISTAMAVVKADKTGKEQQVVMELQQGPDYTCKQYFAVGSADTQRQQIAEKELRGFVQATGVTGIIKSTTLKKLNDAFVVVTAKETKKGDKVYINLVTVEPYDEDPEAEEPITDEPEGEEDPTEEPTTEEPEAEAPVAEEDDDTPPAAKKAAPAKSGRPW